ncbi:MAG TPA: DUF1501 domain-containing protein [Pirellulales bacterium]|nr:DUF1501 domain-containing protein [Pirellulales bacterium]
MLTRRNLLKRSSLLALAPTVPGFLARLARAVEAKRDDRVLVVVQLDGGNDGINTVVPYRDEGYAKYRRQLRLPDDKLHKLADDVALHPSMRAMAELFEKQRLAVVQGVGYPNPNRSHDVSMAIWHTAAFDRAEHKSYGWLGRALDQSPDMNGMNSVPQAMLIGDAALPAALIGRRSIAGTFNRLDELAVQNEAARASVGQAFQPDVPGDGTESRQAGKPDLLPFVSRSALDAYATADTITAAVARQRGRAAYPANELAEHLSLIARLIEADLPTRVYYAVQRGYDTHAVQLPTHARLLGELSGALAAFLNDLTQASLAERVLVMTFSEFGRRVDENASAGTDHGTAAPMFLAGGGVNAGLYGQAPPLNDLDGGDLKMTVDFRRVYATVLRNWLSIEPRLVLDAEFGSLPILKPSASSS